jgi:E3 ubiquitin-protein ligase RNF13
MSYQVDAPNMTHGEPDSDSDNQVLNDYLLSLLIFISFCSARGIIEITKAMWTKCHTTRNKSLLRIRKVTSEDELQIQNECSICLESYVKNQKVISLPCNHVFHSKCIKPWITKNEQSPTCPNCRETIL